MKDSIQAKRSKVLEEHIQELFEECRAAVEEAQEFIAQSQRARKNQRNL